MTATELLHYLQRQGVRITLSVSGDKLHVKAPRDVLTPEVEACIIAHKPALLALLSAHPHRVEKPPLTLITAEQMVNYLTALTKRFGQSHMTLALDLETTGTNFLEERIVAIALGKPGQIVVLDVRPYYDLAAAEQAQWRQALARFLHLPGLGVIGHHLKCDWKFLAGHLGVKLPRVYDTMLVEQVLHGVGPNDAHNAVSLQATAARYGITVSKEQSAWYLHLHQHERAAPFPQEQLIYMAEDIEVPYQIYQRQQALLKVHALQGVAQLENQALPAIAAMEVRGVLADLDDGARCFRLAFLPTPLLSVHHLNREKASLMKKRSTLATREPEPVESMLTIPQVAEVLAVSRATVFRLIKYEGLPVTKMGHTTRIPRNKLHAWIEEHTA